MGTQALGHGDCRRPLHSPDRQGSKILTGAEGSASYMMASRCCLLVGGPSSSPRGLLNKDALVSS